LHDIVFIFLRERRDQPGTQTMNSIMVLIHEYWPILLIFPVAGYLLSRGANKRHAALAARTSEEARDHGMDYSPPAGNETNAGDIQGTHQFSGITLGIPWTAEVTLLTSEVDEGMVTRNMTSLRYTRWTAPEAGTGSGELLLMPLPDGVKKPDATPDTGSFLGSMVAKAAWAASQLYIRLNFGNTRASHLSITHEDHVALPDDDFGRRYTAFCKPPELIHRLTPESRDWLLDERKGKVAMLWDSKGLTLTWPTAHTSSDEVLACAEYGAMLAGLLGIEMTRPEKR